MAGAQIIIVTYVNLSDEGSSKFPCDIDRDGNQILIVTRGTGTREQIPIVVIGMGIWMGTWGTRYPHGEPNPHRDARDGDLDGGRRTRFPCRGRGP